MVQIHVPWPSWSVVRLIGKGGFGSVYEIQRKMFSGSYEKAAMKVISVPVEPEEAQRLLKDYPLESVKQRFRNDLEAIAKEYEVMSKLKGNANIVYCDDIYPELQSDGVSWKLYIKMELLNPLREILRDSVREEQVIGLGMDICKALAALREMNLIHRDIKVDNILVSSDGKFKLGDFGIAKVAEKTASGTKTGTYDYMAPEVYNGQKYGASVDIYSLGMVMYRMLNKWVGPFLPLPPTIPYGNQLEDAKRMRFEGHVLPAPATGSAALQQIVLKACAFCPADRYHSTEEMYADLAQLAGISTIGNSYPVRNTTFGIDQRTQYSRTMVTDSATMGNSWDNQTQATQATWKSETSAAGRTVGAPVVPKAPARKAAPTDFWQEKSSSNTAQTAATTPKTASNKPEKNFIEQIIGFVAETVGESIKTVLIAVFAFLWFEIAIVLPLLIGILMPLIDASLFPIPYLAPLGAVTCFICRRAGEKIIIKGNRTPIGVFLVYVSTIFLLLPIQLPFVSAFSGKEWLFNAAAVIAYGTVCYIFTRLRTSK